MAGQSGWSDQHRRRWLIGNSEAKARPKQTKNNGRTGMTKPDLMAMPRSTLPAAPCFRCGARGWCDHRAPEA